MKTTLLLAGALVILGLVGTSDTRSGLEAATVTTCNSAAGTTATDCLTLIKKLGERYPQDEVLSDNHDHYWIERKDK